MLQIFRVSFGVRDAFLREDSFWRLIIPSAIKSNFEFQIIQKLVHSPTNTEFLAEKKSPKHLLNLSEHTTLLNGFFFFFPQLAKHD